MFSIWNLGFGISDVTQLMKTDDIFTYDKLVAEENANLQKGMNFGIGGSYSVLLMSHRIGATYESQLGKYKLVKVDSDANSLTIN